MTNIDPILEKTLDAASQEVVIEALMQIGEPFQRAAADLVQRIAARHGIDDDGKVKVNGGIVFAEFWSVAITALLNIAVNFIPQEEYHKEIDRFAQAVRTVVDAEIAEKLEAKGD